MKAQKLAGLEPASVFGFFEKICSIPHGSGDTKQISDYLVSFAKERGLRYIQDELNNVILFAPGSAGYEDHDPVILQGHMDMVCEKDQDCSIDFSVDGLNVTHDGECIFANGTTLGGDDGIAVAYALALLDDPSIAHPPLEIIITVDEETGMFGADFIDLSQLKGKRMINLDSEEEGIFTVSCAGGARSNIKMPIERRVVMGPCIRLSVDGLAGGHSGVEIHKNRANANKVMGVLLSRIREKMPLCLGFLSGGSKDNAIPRSCTVCLVAMAMDLEPINGIVEELQQEIRREYDEPEAVITADNMDAMGAAALSTQDTDKVIALLNAVPNGVQAMCEDMPELVQTSLNLGIANLEDKDFSITFSVRSSVNQEKTELLEKLQQIAKMMDASCTEVGHYPAWEYKNDSPLRELMVEKFNQMYGYAPEVVSIHAGLECGLLGEKIPGLDSVSIGPQMHDIHTSRERLEIKSTRRVWEYLLSVLKSM